MIDLTIRNIWQRRVRSSLTVLGVGLAVLLYVYLSTIMNFYDRDLDRTLAGFAGKVIVQARSGEGARFPPTDSLIPLAEAERLLRLPGVDPARSSPVLTEPLVANPAPSMPAKVLAVGIVPGREFAFLGDVPVRGATTLDAPDQVVLGAGAARHYGADVGATVTVKGQELRVVGIIPGETVLLDGAVLMPLDTAQRLFVRPGVVTAVLVTARSVEDVPRVAAAVAAGDGSLVASTPADLARGANAMLGPQRAFFATVRGTLVAVGVIVVAVVMIMAVAERRREIGTLKALGAGRRHVLALVLAEAVALSLAGGLGALLVAWALTRRDAMPVDGRLALQTLGVAVAVGALAALWPAWAAQRVDPIESLRYE